MPNTHPDWDLSEHFVDFFVDNRKSGNKLDWCALYKPGLQDGLAILNMFKPVSELVGEKKCKSCELGLIPQK